MAKGLDIRRRIKSIKSTRSITKAMQMVAASKMKKAQEQALKTRSYAEKALEILATVSDKVGDYKHYLLDKTEGNRYLVLLITANKGLCGSLNANVIRKAIEFMEGKTKSAISKEKEVNMVSEMNNEIYHFTTLGKKGRDAMMRLGKIITADFSDIGDNISFLDIAPLTRQLLDEYREKKYDRIYIVYTHFVSVLIQKAVVKRVVPLGRDILESMKDIMMKKDISQRVSVSLQETQYEYLFEPDPKEVLDDLLPRLVEMQIYQSVLEASASEHSARMVAMKNATEAAGDLMNDLTLTYNKTRQASITQEISEIVGGVEALQKV